MTNIQYYVSMHEMRVGVRACSVARGRSVLLFAACRNMCPLSCRLHVRLNALCDYSVSISAGALDRVKRYNLHLVTDSERSRHGSHHGG